VKRVVADTNVLVIALQFGGKPNSSSTSPPMVRSTLPSPKPSSQRPFASSGTSSTGRLSGLLRPTGSCVSSPGASNVYGGPRFTHLYRKWLADERTALQPVPRAIQAALGDGRGSIECVVLSQTYDHLLPVVERQIPRRGPHAGERHRRSQPLPV
jgi:hypothetical protein